MWAFRLFLHSDFKVYNESFLIIFRIDNRILRKSAMLEYHSNFAVSFSGAWLRDSSSVCCIGYSKRNEWKRDWFGDIGLKRGKSSKSPLISSHHL
jgi:hypothetical protein